MGELSRYENVYPTPTGARPDGASLAACGLPITKGTIRASRPLGFAGHPMLKPSKNRTVFTNRRANE